MRRIVLSHRAAVAIIITYFHANYSGLISAGMRAQESSSINSFPGNRDWLGPREESAMVRVQVLLRAEATVPHSSNRPSEPDLFGQTTASSGDNRASNLEIPASESDSN